MSNTVGIFLNGQVGDIMEASCVIHYKNELWGNGCRIVWYLDDTNRDIFKHQDIELRTFPRGFGYPKMVEEENAKLIADGQEPIWRDYSELVDWDNKMNVALKYKYPELEELDFGFFPAPHQMDVTKRNNTEYSLISKRVFSVPMEWQWHPVLKFSEQERVDAAEFIGGMFFLNKVVAIETFAGSGQSLINDKMVRETMRMCKEEFGECNFVFVSHKYLRDSEDFPQDFKDKKGIYFASHFTVRQCALIVGLSDLLISVSSGITVASSCWGNNPTSIIQYTGSEVCSTKSIALGRYELVTYDALPLHVAENNYYEKLNLLLNSIK